MPSGCGPSPNVSRRQGGSVDVDGKRAQLGELQQQASDPGLWDDPAHGQQVTSRLARLTSEVDRYDALQRRLGDATAIDELLTGSTDPDLQRELEQTLAALEVDLEKVELAAL